MSSLPPVPNITSDDPNMQAMVQYLQSLSNGFDNAAAQAVDYSDDGFSGGDTGQGGPLTVTEEPTNITYTDGANGDSTDGTIYGSQLIAFTLPARAVKARVFYRLLGDTGFEERTFDQSPARVDNLKVGVTYQFQLAGEASNGYVGPKSDLSNESIGDTLGEPAAPTGLAATAYQAEIQITWDDHPDATVKSYELQRADDAGFTVNVVTIQRIRSTGWVDQFTGIGVVRHYRVRAIRNTGEVSDYTSGVTATTTGINTEDINPGAVTDSDSDYTAGTISCNASAETIIATITPTVDQGFLILAGGAEAALNPDESVTLRIRRDDETGDLLAGPVTSTLSTLALSPAGVSVVGIDLTPSGAETYVLTAEITGAAARNVSERRLIAGIFKV